jgi:PPM family protein phosphatase
MKIAAMGLSDVGQKRETNQDKFLVDNETLLFGVADGMGGHRGGGVASKLAVDTIHSYIKSHKHEDPEKIIERAIQEASKTIYESSVGKNELAGMGTTATFAWIKGQSIFIAHVGDSRAYLLRGNKIWQLTEDHSLVHEQVKAGVLPESAEKEHLYRNVLTRSVGFEPFVKVDIYQKELEVGDKFLICSDGLIGMLEAGEISNIVNKKPMNEALKKLVETANARGGEDNITTILINIESD